MLWKEMCEAIEGPFGGEKRPEALKQYVSMRNDWYRQQYPRDHDYVAFLEWADAHAETSAFSINISEMRYELNMEYSV